MLLREISYPRDVSLGIRGFPRGQVAGSELLLPEVAFSRGVFLRIQRFPMVKWRILGAVLGREPRQAQGNNAIHVGAKNMPARPCNL